MSIKKVEAIKSKLSTEDIKQFFSKQNVQLQAEILKSDPAKNAEQIEGAIINLAAHFQKALELAASKELTAKESTQIFHDLAKIGSIPPQLGENLELAADEQKYLKNLIYNLDFIRHGIFSITLDAEKISGRQDEQKMQKVNKCVKYIGDPLLDLNIKKIILNLDAPGGKFNDLLLTNPAQFMVEAPEDELEQGNITKVPFHEWAYNTELLNSSGEHLILDAIEKYKSAAKDDADIQQKQENYDQYIQFICENGIKIKPEDINPALLTENSISLLFKNKILNEDQVMGMVEYQALTYNALLAPYKEATVFEAYCSRAKTTKAKELVAEQITNAIKQIQEIKDDVSRETSSAQVLNMSKMALKHDSLTGDEIGKLLESGIIDMQILRDWTSQGILNYDILNQVIFTHEKRTLGQIFIAEDVYVGDARLADWMDEKFAEEHKGYESKFRYRDYDIAMLIAQYQGSGLEGDFTKLVDVLYDGISKDRAERRVDSSVLTQVPLSNLALFRRIVSSALRAPDFQKLYTLLPFDALFPIVFNQVPIDGKHPLIALGDISIPALSHFQTSLMLSEMVAHTVDEHGTPIPIGLAAQQDGAMTLFEYAYANQMQISFFEDPSKDQDLTKVMVNSIALMIGEIQADMENTENQKERDSLQEKLQYQMGHLEQIADIESIPSSHFIKMIDGTNTKAISTILTTRIERNPAKAFVISAEITAAYINADKELKNHMNQINKDCRQVIYEKGSKLGEKSSKFFLNLLNYCASNLKVARNLAHKSFGQYVSKSHSKTPNLNVDAAVKMDFPDSAQSKSVAQMETATAQGRSAEDIIIGDDDIAIAVKVISGLNNLELDQKEQLLKALNSAVESEKPEVGPKASGKKILGSERVHAIYEVIIRIITRMLRKEGPIAQKALQEVIDNGPDSVKGAGAQQQNPEQQAEQNVEQLQDVLAEQVKILREGVAPLTAEQLELEKQMQDIASSKSADAGPSL